MSFSQFDNIRVVLAEPNAEVRTELVESLREYGFRNIVPTGNLSSIVKATRARRVDLIIADTSLPEGDFNAFVRDMRFGREGDNPFLVVITMVSEPSRQAVHAAINSGTDHVLAKPFASEELIDKIKELTHSRKRFVATADYIGPDRRTKRRPGTLEVPLIDVPNPLHHRMSGHISDNHVHRLVHSAVQRINEQMVQRQAYQIGWLLDDALPQMRLGQVGGESDGVESLLKLSEVSQDICKRLKGTSFAHVAAVCMTLDRMLGEAIENGLSEEDMQLMTRMGDIIAGVFDPNRMETAMQYQRHTRSLDVFKVNEDETDETAPETQLNALDMPKAMADMVVN